MNIFLSNFEYFIEKKFDFSTRVWVFILNVPNLYPRGRTHSTKSAKNCCHVGIVEVFHLWSLNTSVKAKKLTSKVSKLLIKGFEASSRLCESEK